VAPALGGSAAAVEAIRHEGYPTTLAELNAWYVEPPAARNAAPLYVAAFAALTQTNPASPSFLTGNQKALALLHQAAGRAQCRYPVDLTPGFTTRLPHLVNVKVSAQLLQQEAAANAAKGRADLAQQSVLAGLSLTRSLEQEPVLISQLMRIAATDLTVTGLELTLNRKALSEEQAAALATAFQAAEDNADAALVRGLAGERCCAMAMFASPTRWHEVFSLMAEDSGAPPLAQAPEVDKFMESYSASPALQEDLDFYLKNMQSLFAMAKTPTPAGLEAAKAWSASIKAKGPFDHVYSRILLPALELALERSAIAVAELRTAQGALAIERYRLAHNNALPDTLNQLVPQYLKSVPQDPFDGRPLRFKKHPSRGYTVYSIGRDRQDNGGRHKMAKMPRGTLYDLAFTVNR
jgi:hypothetical protein